MAESSQARDGDGSSSANRRPARRVNSIVLGSLVVLVLAVLAAVFFAYRFVEDERLRTLQEWQVRLGIVADSRVAAVDAWVDGNFATLRELAQNASLQIYMTELSEAGGDRSAVTDEPAQATYLRNLLVATAERSGFKAPEPVGEIAANVERPGIAGIGLADANGLAIASSPGMPPLTGRIRTAIAAALEGQPAFIDMYVGAGNQPTVGFALPVFGIQDGAGARGIGVVVGIRVSDEDLYRNLRQPGETARTAETFLVRAHDNVVEYLSPLADGTAPLKRTLARDTPDLDAAFAIEKPGGFTVGRDHAGDEVLVVSRALASTPWVLVRKVTRAEALAATETRLRTILIVFVLITVGVAVTIVAVWRHGTSVRASEAAERYRVSSERFENIGKFMRVVTNSQRTAIAAVDGTTTYTFANLPAAQEAGIAPEDMLGKTMASVMGPVKATHFADINREVLARFAESERAGDPDSVAKCRETHIKTFGLDGGEVQVIRSDHVPLRGDRDHPPGVLMVLDDITELTRERRRSEYILRQLIDTLVGVVDRRDPYSANHSARVAEVAKAIAQEMAAPELDVTTVDIAGSLMSLGKIFIPSEVLSKGNDLTPEERQMVMGAYAVSAELLANVPFDGPVVDTIRQIGETWDGRGPLGLADGSVLATARILAVANTFVGMVSARAYRQAMPFEDAAKILLDEAGKRFDRKPVSALINVLENRGGIERWSHFRDPPRR